MKKFASYMTSKNLTIFAVVVLAICAYFGVLSKPAMAFVALPFLAGAVTFDLAATSGVPAVDGQNKNFPISEIITVPVGAVSTDILQCLNIPAGTYVRNVFVEIITACTATSITATVGDGAGANSWDASTNLAAAAGTVTAGVGGTDAYVTSGKLYATADTIDLVVTVNTLTVGGKFRITADCFKAA